MLTSFSLTSAAHEDIDAVHAWYMQISPRLTDDFISDLEESFSRILRASESYPVFHKAYRRALMHRFKYMVIFRIKNDTAIISMILHQKRSPTHWQKRLH